MLYYDIKHNNQPLVLGPRKRCSSRIHAEADHFPFLWVVLINGWMYLIKCTRICDGYGVFCGTNKRQAFTIRTHSQSIRSPIRTAHNHVTFTTDSTRASSL